MFRSRLSRVDNNLINYLLSFLADSNTVYEGIWFSNENECFLNTNQPNLTNVGFVNHGTAVSDLQVRSMQGVT